VKLGRRFVLIEQDVGYVNIIRDEVKSWLGQEAENVLTINCSPVEVSDMLF
jgi:DNA modification methylase